MKRKLNVLSQHYVAALKQHLLAGSATGLQAARELGRQAVDLGLETLAVAKIHDQSLAALKAAGGAAPTAKQAKTFFIEVLAPIEKTHQVAILAGSQLRVLNQTLGRRGVALAVSRKSLRQGIAGRKAAEKALAQSVRHSQKLLRESHRLQRHLQLLAHRILSAQEEKRKQISLQLQNEIAQTLLGINVRLLSLKREAGQHAAGLRQEIAVTRRLVNDSQLTLNGLATQFKVGHES